MLKRVVGETPERPTSTQKDSGVSSLLFIHFFDDHYLRPHGLLGPKFTSRNAIAICASSEHTGVLILASALQTSSITQSWRSTAQNVAESILYKCGATVFGTRARFGVMARLTMQCVLISGSMQPQVANTACTNRGGVTRC